MRLENPPPPEPTEGKPHLFLSRSNPNSHGYCSRDMNSYDNPNILVYIYIYVGESEGNPNSEESPESQAKETSSSPEQVKKKAKEEPKQSWGDFTLTTLIALIP